MYSQKDAQAAPCNVPPHDIGAQNGRQPALHPNAGYRSDESPESHLYVQILLLLGQWHLAPLQDVPSKTGRGLRQLREIHDSRPALVLHCRAGICLRVRTTKLSGLQQKVGEIHHHKVVKEFIRKLVTLLRVDESLTPIVLDESGIVMKVQDRRLELDQQFDIAPGE